MIYTYFRLRKLVCNEATNLTRIYIYENVFLKKSTMKHLSTSNVSYVHDTCVKNLIMFLTIFNSKCSVSYTQEMFYNTNTWFWHCTIWSCNICLNTISENLDFKLKLCHWRRNSNVIQLQDNVSFLFDTQVYTALHKSKQRVGQRHTRLQCHIHWYRIPILFACYNGIG